MAIQLGSAYAKVDLDASGVKSGVATATSSLQNLASAGMKIGQTMQGIGAAMTIGLTVPIIAFFKASVTSAMEAENALTELNAVLESTHGVAGVTADEITKMASELQKVTKFSDDAIISGQSMLLTFTNIGKDVFPQATEAMLNMAEKFGSVEEASIQLGKALNDPVQGVTALRRVGVQLSDAQEQQIKAFVAVNDIASAQKVILQELETEFGGLAKAAGETTAGQFARLANQFDDLKEKVGAILIPIILDFVEVLTKLIEAFMALPDWVQKIILVFLALVALAGPVLIFVGSIISAISSITMFLAPGGALAILLPTIAAAFSTIGTVIFGTVIPAIVAFVAAAAPVIIAILLIVGAIALLYWAFKTNFLGITDTAKKLWFIIKYEFGKGWDYVKARSAEGMENLKSSWAQGVESVQTKLQQGIAGWMLAFQTLGTWLWQWARNAVQGFLNIFNINWAQIGQNIVTGIINGLNSMWDALMQFVTDMANAVMDTFDAVMDSGSPSREFDKRGLWAAQGYIQGMKRGFQPAVFAQLAAIPLQAATLGGSGGAQIQQINHFGYGLTEQHASRMIQDSREDLVTRLTQALESWNG